MRVVVVLTAGLALAACEPRRNVVDPLDSGPADVGASDAGTDLPDALEVRDAPALDDGRVPIEDAGPPLEPEVARDEHPSDRAMGWIDPPASHAGPCCDVGDVVALDDPSHQASAVFAAWNGEHWGVAWGDLGNPMLFEPVTGSFQLLDANGQPFGDRIRYDEMTTTMAGLAFGNGRFGVLTSSYAYTRPAGSGSIHALDPEGALVETRALPDDFVGAAIARHPIVHGWAAVAHPLDGLDDVRPGSLVLFDDSLGETARRDLGALSDDPRHSAVTSVASRLVVASGTGPLYLRTYANREVELVDETTVRLTGAELAIASLRDEVVLASRNQDVGPIEITIFDPFTSSLVSGPTERARTASGQGIGLAADSAGGTLGLCYPVGGEAHVRDADAVGFSLLGPDGVAIAEPVEIGSAYRYVVTCSVAVAGRDRYLVVWWAADYRESGASHSVYAATVDVRRG